MMGRNISQFHLLTAAVLLCACGLGSCSQGPAPVRPGTPAFFWAAADSAWRAGDYIDKRKPQPTGDGRQ